MQVGPYLIQGELGRGGMGVVYRVQGPDGGVYALKRLSTESNTDDRLRLRRIARELEAMQRIDHPNVVRAVDSGWASGAFFIVMELVHGVSLGERLRSEGPLEVREAVGLCADLARALHYLHEQGIVHRDVKPDNVLVEEGRPRLTDMGLARLRDDDQRLTKTGTAMGTPGYCAPELLSSKGAGGGEPSPAIDIYGVGATLYALLSGHAPFEGASHYEVAVQTVEHAPLAPSQRLLKSSYQGDVAAVARLDGVVLRCLAKDPQDRYASALDLADDLEAAGYGAAPRRSVVKPALGLALLAGAAGAGAFWLRGALQTPAPVAAAPVAAPEPTSSPVPPAPASPAPPPIDRPTPSATPAPTRSASPKPSRAPTPTLTATPAAGLDDGRPVQRVGDLAPLGRLAKYVWQARGKGWDLRRVGGFAQLRSTTGERAQIRYFQLKNSNPAKRALHASLTVECEPGQPELRAGLLYGRPDQKRYLLIGLTGARRRFVMVRTREGLQRKLENQAPRGARSFQAEEGPGRELVVRFDGEVRLRIKNGALPDAAAGLFVIGSGRARFQDVQVRWR